MKNNSLHPDWIGGPDGPVGPGSPLTDKEWKEGYNRLKSHAEAMARIFNDLARKISADAGLDPNLLGIHPHNAMCGLAYGNPWREVDYNRCQAIVDLLAHEFDAHRMVAAFDKATRCDPHDRWLQANPYIPTPEEVAKQEAELDKAIAEIGPLLGF